MSVMPVMMLVVPAMSPTAAANWRGSTRHIGARIGDAIVDPTHGLAERLRTALGEGRGGQREHRSHGQDDKLHGGHLLLLHDQQIAQRI